MKNIKRALFYRNFVSGSLQHRFKRINWGVFCFRDFLLQDGPHRVLHCVEVWRVWQPNILTPKDEETAFHRRRSLIEPNVSPSIAEAWIHRRWSTRRTRYWYLAALILTFRSMKINGVFLVARMSVHTMTKAEKQLCVNFAVVCFCAFLSNWRWFLLLLSCSIEKNFCRRRQT